MSSFRFTAWKSVGQTADALHQAGHLDEAEAMQKERQPEYPLLYSMQGYRYCDLLLSRAAQSSSQREPALNSFGIADVKSKSRLTPAATVDEALSICRDVQKRADKMFEWRVPGVAAGSGVASSERGCGRRPSRSNPGKHRSSE